MIEADQVDKIRDLLATLGLPTRLPLPVQVEELISYMRLDKKTVNDSIRLVLPTASGASIVDGIDDGAIGLSWSSVGASA